MPPSYVPVQENPTLKIVFYPKVSLRYAYSSPGIDEEISVRSYNQPVLIVWQHISVGSYQLKRDDYTFDGKRHQCRVFLIPGIDATYISEGFLEYPTLVTLIILLLISDT